MSTWLLVCTWLGLGVPMLGEGGGPGPGSFTCLNNNILRIDCHWSAPELGGRLSPWLLFTRNHEPHSRHRCVFRTSVCTLVLPPEEILMLSDNFTITLHRHISGKERVSLVDPQYLPRRHVKLDPPSDLQSNVSSGSCVLTWSISPVLQPLASLLGYELAFKRQEEAWERARRKDRIFGVTSLILEAVELDPGYVYEARLRVQMATLESAMAEEERYEGPWSEWSQPVLFASPQRPSPLMTPVGQPNSTLVAVSIFLLLTSLTYVLFRLSPRSAHEEALTVLSGLRVKRTFHQNVPSPAAFFRPLYSVHSGNFRTWTGTHRPGVRLSQDLAGAVAGAPEPSVRDAIALLTYDPVDAWPFVGLEDEGTGTGLQVDVLPVALEWGGQPPAYLPQEEWAALGPSRPAPPPSEGGSADYCALGCYEGCHSSSSPGISESSGPIQPLACDPQSLDVRQGGSHVGAGHDQRQDPGEEAA